MANGINTDIFQKDRKDRVRDNLYEAIIGQKQDPEDFLLEEPDRPEMDEERQKQLRRLATVSALGEGISAVTNAIGVGTDERWAPVQTGMSDLGVTSFNELARMDRQHRNRLNQFQKNVLNTRRSNQQTRAQVGTRNAQVDLQAAQQRYKDYMNDAQANRQAEQVKNELAQQTELNDQQAWRQAGMRLISNGQEKAGVAALGKGGLSTEDIAGMLGGGGGGGQMNVDPETRTRQNMVRRYNELISEVNQSDYSGGDPMTAQARELEFLKDQLGTDLYNPLYLPGEQQEDNDSEEQPVSISPQNQRRIEGGLNTEEVQEGLNSPESIAEENRDLVNQIRQSSDQQQRRQYAEQLVKNWQQLGMTQQQIEQGLERLFGDSQQNNQNSNFTERRRLYE